MVITKLFSAVPRLIAYIEIISYYKYNGKSNAQLYYIL